MAGGAAPGPWAPPPYEERGPDGKTYYKIAPPIPGLIRTWTELGKLINDYRALARRGHPAAAGKAQLLARVAAELEKKMIQGEIAVAEHTDVSVRERIKLTQKRPDAPQGASMIHGIESRPIKFDVPLFAIGQVDIGILNKAATRPGAQKPYWRSQEYGSSHIVGKRPRGYFQPGSAPPDPGQFRVHPVFTAASGGPRMRIRRPIEERAFLRSGTMAGAILRRRLWTSIQKQTVAEMQRVLTLRGPGRGRRLRP